MGKRSMAAAVVLAALLFLYAGAVAATEKLQKPRIAPACKQCHKPDENKLIGLFTSVSKKVGIIQMQIGNAVWLVKFDDETKLIGAESLRHIPKEREIAVTVSQKNGDIYAVSISVKPPVKVSDEKLVKIDELVRLVASGHERSNFFLVDSRPAQRFNEGHIPGAVSLPDSEFDRLSGKLPKEKDKLIIFYCAGPTCRFSSSSAAKADKSGYRNVKVFVDGMPLWKKSNNLILSNIQNLKEMMDRDIPYIVIDVRPTEESKRGHITAAVSMPPRDMANAKDKFPADKLAPIILYDNDTIAAVDDFMVVRGWGYSNVSVLEGGLDAWRKAGGLIVSGDVASKIIYVPRLKPGEIPVEEFRKLTEVLPADKLMLDVRLEDEVAQGMLKGAKNIPLGDINARMKDIPKDKEIIVYCGSGIRAEMAYHTLKEAGYKVRYLNAHLKIDKDGKYTITRE